MTDPTACSQPHAPTETAAETSTSLTHRCVEKRCEDGGSESTAATVRIAVQSFDSATFSDDSLMQVLPVLNSTLHSCGSKSWIHCGLP